MNDVDRTALVTSARPAADDPEAPLARRSPYSRWRVGTLILVYLLMAAHIVHWRLAGKTLAPLELHEVMYTTELGVVTAGFLFMAAAVIATALFGRFFCGWGCHLLALQDLSGWLLRKLGIRRKPIRARLIAWAPLLVMFYMFVWPQLTRMFAGRPHPGFRIADDSEPIASFSTTDFWRNLPDPWVSGLTFLVCGGLVVYVLGSRGFCSYACPYGALFGLVDRLSPFRIRSNEHCQQCGTCTKVCSSGIAVHDQVRLHGAIVDPRCMKDLDCVGACPHDALHYGFGAPSLFARGTGETARPASHFEFSLREELAMAVVFVATIAVFRGLYDAVPFLMSVGLGAAAAFAIVLAWRICRDREAKLGRRPLKSRGRITALGAWFAGATAAFALLFAHSAVVQLSLLRGKNAYAEAAALPREARGPALATALADLDRVDRWSLLATAEPKVALAWTRALAGDAAAAQQLFGEAARLAPRDGSIRYYLAGFLARAGDRDGALRELREAARLEPNNQQVRERLEQLERATTPR